MENLLDSTILKEKNLNEELILGKEEPEKNIIS